MVADLNAKQQFRYTRVELFIFLMYCNFDLIIRDNICLPEPIRQDIINFIYSFCVTCQSEHSGRFGVLLL